MRWYLRCVVVYALAAVFGLWASGAFAQTKQNVELWRFDSAGSGLIPASGYVYKSRREALQGACDYYEYRISSAALTFGVCNISGPVGSESAYVAGYRCAFPGDGVAPGACLGQNSPGHTGNTTLGATKQVQSVCPGGSVPSGASACVCPAGTSWDGAKCAVDDGCKTAYRTHSISECGDSTGCGWRVGSSSVRELCYPKGDGMGGICKVRLDSWFKEDDGSVWGYGEASSAVDATGGCVAGGTSSDGGQQADIPSVPPNTCQKGLCPGNVNGTDVCVPCGASSEAGSSTKKSDGTSQIESTSCDGGTCTTTTIDKDANGIETGRVTRQEPITSYCSRFPLSGHCSGVTNSGGGIGGSSADSKGSGYGQHSGSGSGGGGDCTGPDCGDGDSSFGGNCASSFTCSGDAVQCAIAKDQHIRHCTLFDDANPLATIGTAGMTGESRPADHPANGPDASALDFSSQIDTSSPIGSGGCPSDITIGALSIPLSVACTELAMLGNLLMGITMLAAAFIAFKG